VQTDALVSGFIRVLGKVASVIPEGDSNAEEGTRGKASEKNHTYN